MSILEILVLLLIAGICGSIGQAIAGFSRGGCLASILIGFIGAVLGMWLQRLTEAPELFTIQVGDKAFPIIWSIIGAVIFVVIVSILTPRPRQTDAPL